MKKIFLIFILFNSLVSFAQDLITLKNGIDIKSKVFEINLNEIKYKKYDNLNGPLISILKDDVLIIRYENGSKDIFQDIQNKETEDSKNINIENFKSKNITTNISRSDFSLARLKKTNNKYVFLWSMPFNNYDVAFTFKNSISYIDCISPEQMAIESIKNANIESANQNKLYDAIICEYGSHRDIAIVWKNPELDNSLARVDKIEGVYVFVQCEPLIDYAVIQKYNLSGIGHYLLTNTCPTHTQRISKIIKKSINDNLDFDAIMYGSSKYEFSIKFK